MVQRIGYCTIQKHNFFNSGFVVLYKTDYFLFTGTSITSDEVAVSDNVTLHSTDLSTHHFRQDQDLSVYLGAYCVMFDLIVERGGSVVRPGD